MIFTRSGGNFEFVADILYYRIVSVALERVTSACRHRGVPTMAKKRLLIIEDDVDVAEMLVIYFTSQGYEVLNALTGNDGIAAARAKFPNLILLDVMLPDMDGFDVAKALRTTTLTKYIPITFLTQRDARADKVAGFGIGAGDFISKTIFFVEKQICVHRTLCRLARRQLPDH